TNIRVYSDEDDLDFLPIYTPDACDIGIGSLKLRAECNPLRDGRVYIIIVSVTDHAGHTGYGVKAVVVPLSTRARDVDWANAQAAAALQYFAQHHCPPANYYCIGDLL